MLIVNHEATKERIKDRCVAVQRVAVKYEINKNSLQKFVEGQFFGKSGQGEYGRCEKALIEMGLLVFDLVPDPPKEKSPA
jgi:hypothetical protein